MEKMKKRKNGITSTRNNKLSFSVIQMIKNNNLFKFQDTCFELIILKCIFGKYFISYQN